MLHIEDITGEKEISRMRSELISNVSHELRTPLYIIKEGLSLVLDERLGPIKVDQKDILLRVKNNTDRLERLLDDLLDVSKLEAGKMVLKKSLINIQSLVEEVMSSFKGLTGRKTIELITHFNITSPDIFVDKDKISQVLTNLISNGIKFTPKNGQVTLRMEERRKEIEISVEDTGIGISQKNIPKLFERFSQFNRINGPREKGTGLGLAISKEIVEIHNGKIWGESKFGKGSKFTFSLPKLSQEEIFKEFLNSGMREADVKGCSLSLIIIHIKNFKGLKRKYGRSEGLLIVQEIERVVRRTLRRKSDIVSRYKNDETIIPILMDTPKQNASYVKERIRGILDMEIRKIEILKNRNISILLDEVNYPDDAIKEEELIDKIEKCIGLK